MWRYTCPDSNLVALSDGGNFMGNLPVVLFLYVFAEMDDDDADVY